MAGVPVAGRQQLNIDDRNTARLGTLQVTVRVRNAQMADPELSSALALFRRAANVVARLEDAVIFRGLAPGLPALGGFVPPGGLAGLPAIWQITGALAARGNLDTSLPPGPVDSYPRNAISSERPGARYWGFPCHRPPGAEAGSSVRSLRCLVNSCFLSRRPQTRGRSSCRRTGSSRSLAAVRCSVPQRLTCSSGFTGVVVALGGAPLELVVATDVCLQFLQVTADPVFFFRLSEKIALRIKELCRDRPALYAAMRFRRPPRRRRPREGRKEPSDHSTTSRRVTVVTAQTA